ncbi:MAG: hypothetical protein U1F16_12255 [Turneriella sp.]
MFINKLSVTSCLAAMLALNCGSSSATARIVTHPVMVGPITGIKAREKAAPVGAYEITLTNESFASAGGAFSREEALKTDASLLKAIKKLKRPSYRKSSSV